MKGHFSVSETMAQTRTHHHRPEQTDKDRAPGRPSSGSPSLGNALTMTELNDSSKSD